MRIDSVLPGESVSGYTRSVESTSVRHALLRHSNPTEYLQSQVPIGPADLDLYLSVVRNPDRVAYDGLSNFKNPVILYSKKINGHIIFVEEVRRGRHQLAFKSMRKLKR